MHFAWCHVLVAITLVNIVRSANVPIPKPRNVNYGVSSPATTVTPQVTRFGALVAKNVPRSRSSLNRGSGTKRNYTGGQIITSRFGEQCECVSYHLCDAKDVFHDADQKSVDCGDKVCCSLPILILTPTPSPVIDPTDPTTGGCTCVVANQCTLTGVGVLDPKFKECSSPIEICCPEERIVKPTPTSNWTPATPTSNWTPATPTTSNCQCISKSRCQDSSCGSTPNYGIQHIDDRTTKEDKCYGACGGCDNSEICCPSELIDTNPYVSDTKNCPSPIPAEYTYKGCGYVGSFDSLGQRITSGAEDADVVFGEYPWMALILRKDETGHETLVCGGSLLSSKVVLTAAHCVDKDDKSTLIVRLGEYNTKSYDEKLPHQDRSISEIITHEHYVSKINWNDVAIIIVNTPFEYAANVAPICLPFSVNSSFSDPSVYDGSKCFVAGWGKNAYDGEYSSTLRKVDLEVVPVETCQEKLRRTELGRDFILHKSFTCAVGHNGKDACKGDGGGPLFCALRNEPGRYVQVGITSWGLKSCGTGDPGVYASVYYNSPWITQQFLVYNNFKINDQGIE